ncbi:DUF4232 domain-containing protein [Actinoallomurus acaciae]|uniref:DUF4232 domain-containing protein n=1 Tax=Actinoallomurus acaciae TaxID=502577 RepID=A0ABV5YLF6_9ACTN
MVALVLTGCNTDGKASTASGSSAKTAPAAHDTHGKKAEVAYAGQGETPSCMASELKADLQLQPPRSEQSEKVIATLILTNRSGESCYLPAGWALLGKGGKYNYTTIPATRVSYPGAGRTITLRPGGSAFAGTRWHFEKGCPGGITDGFGVAWHSSWIPLTYHGLDDGYQPPICDSLTLGTLQPTMNGVNFT